MPSVWLNRFTTEGELIGFDGSQAIGREEILSHLKPIFANHPTPPFISKVIDIRILDTDIAILRAIVGMISHGKSDLVPELNAHQTIVAVKREDEWRIELFQNTPAQFHGRPELVEQMTEELRQLLKSKLPDKWSYSTRRSKMHDGCLPWLPFFCYSTIGHNCGKKWYNYYCVI